MRNTMMQKCEFSKMRDCSGFLQIGSHISGLSVPVQSTIGNSFTKVAIETFTIILNKTLALNLFSYGYL